MRDFTFLLSFVTIVTFVAGAAHATTAQSAPDPQSFAGRSEMNGFKLRDFEDFEKNWHFVTVRFRRDTGEMRFTYANDLAWTALLSHTKDYPKGAVFAKIGVATQNDPSFPSAAVPSGARRTQFMVRDSKFTETDGWGYALFDANGKTFPEDPMKTSAACAACHRIVPEKGYVFSEPIDIPQFNIKVQTSPSFVFDDVKSAKLPEPIRKYVLSDSVVRVLGGELRKYLFQGTLDEIRPVLAAEAIRSKAPTLFMSEDEKRFSLVVRDPNGKCASVGDVALRGVSNISFKGAELNDVHFCQAKSGATAPEASLGGQKSFSNRSASPLASRKVSGLFHQHQD